MARRKTYTAEEVGNQHGFQCPKCRKGDSLSISATQWHDLFPDGTDNHGDVEWEDDSPAMCNNTGCGWHGTVDQLKQVDIKD